MRRVVRASAWVPTTSLTTGAVHRQQFCLVALAFGLLFSCGRSDGVSTTPRDTTLPARSSPPPVPPDAGGGAAVANASNLVVELEQARKLRLVEWFWNRKPVGVGLEGTLVARVTNTASVPVAIKGLEVHGLLFSDITQGTPYVIINPSQCMRDFALPSEPTIQLAPGQSHEYVFDSWGSAGSMWRAPPPGNYRVVYRVLLDDGASREVPEDPGSIQVLENGERMLQSREYWRDAAVSKPLEISLEAPVKQQIEP